MAIKLGHVHGRDVLASSRQRVTLWLTKPAPRVPDRNDLDSIGDVGLSTAATGKAGLTGSGLSALLVANSRALVRRHPRDPARRRGRAPRARFRPRCERPSPGPRRWIGSAACVVALRWWSACQWPCWPAWRRLRHARTGLRARGWMCRSRAWMGLPPAASRLARRLTASGSRSRAWAGRRRASSPTATAARVCAWRPAATASRSPRAATMRPHGRRRSRCEEATGCSSSLSSAASADELGSLRLRARGAEVAQQGMPSRGPTGGLEPPTPSLRGRPGGELESEEGEESR
jgi:hypothetical protein